MTSGEPNERVDDDTGALRAMQAQLSLGMFLLASLTCGGLALRELVRGGPYGVPAVGSLACLGISWWSRRHGPTRGLTLAFLGLLVALVTSAALRSGGAAASALCFAFLPGLVAILLVGPALGWIVCVAMLASLGTLLALSPPLRGYDLLRFIDELGMTVWTATLAHALHRSFGRYEAAISGQRRALLQLRDRRHAMATAVYEQLEPLSLELEASANTADGRGFDRARCQSSLRRMIEQLGRAKALAQNEQLGATELDVSDGDIRRRTMRRWLQLGALFMVFIVARNFWLGVSYLPSLVSVGFCLAFDQWLKRSASLAHLELTALALGLAATGPMAIHIYNYGGRPDAPALVVTPATVLFTAVLSQGPAAWAIVALNGGILVWVGGGQLSPFESRLLSDLFAAFLAITLALRGIFKLRSQYTSTMLEQNREVVEALRQHRRLAGTLFHDVSNQLQTLAFYVESDDEAETSSLGSLASRVSSMISLSKEFLVGQGEARAALRESCRLEDAVRELKEAFGPRLRAKGTRLAVEQGLELSVLGQPELLVESVLGNLMSNAIKFSPPGSLITLRAEQFGKEVRVSLRDQGPGLPERVTRGLGRDAALPSTPGTAGEEGQGYGLQLVREHVTRMGGRLELARHASGGTEASIWLPSAVAG